MGKTRRYLEQIKRLAMVADAMEHQAETKKFHMSLMQRCQTVLQSFFLE